MKQEISSDDSVKGVSEKVPESEMEVDNETHQEFPTFKEHFEAFKKCREIFNKIKSLTEPKNEEEILCILKDYKLSRKDLRTLQGKCWLNDEIINAYLCLLTGRNKQHKNWPSMYVFNTYFIIALIANRRVSRWTKNTDLLLYDIILIPVNSGNNHWVLICVDNRSKTIIWYDSLKGKGDVYLEAVHKYILSVYEDKKITPENSYTLKHAEDIPEQKNSYDCGIFVLTYAEYISRNAEFTFKQIDMPHLRIKVMHELLNNELLEEEDKQEKINDVPHENLTGHYDTDHPAEVTDAIDDKQEKINDVQHENFSQFYNTDDPAEVTDAIDENPIKEYQPMKKWLKKLTNEDKKEMVNLLLDEEKLDHIYCTVHGYPLIQRDLLKLLNGLWITDQIVNCYLCLLTHRSMQKKNLPSLFAFNTSFFECLKANHNLSKWTNGVDILLYDIILIPVNHSGQHWSLICVDTQSKNIKCYDSLREKREKHLEVVRKYILELHYLKYMKADKNLYITSIAKNIPLQCTLKSSETEFDSGIFVLTYAEYISRNAKLCFTKEKIHYNRIRITNELINGQLLEEMEEQGDRELPTDTGVTTSKVPVEKSDCKSKSPEHSIGSGNAIKFKFQTLFENFYQKDILRIVQTSKLDENDIVSVRNGSPTSQAISSYLLLIEKRGEKKTFPSVYVLQDPFYNILVKEGPMIALKHNNENIFLYDLILVPVCSDPHWSLFVIDNLKFKIQYYDVQNKCKNLNLNILNDYLKTEMREKHNFTLQDDYYKLETVTEPFQQANDDDPAIFMLLFAEHLTRYAKITLNRSIHFYRSKMALELMKCKLENSEGPWDSLNTSTDTYDLLEIKESTCPWKHSIKGFSSAERNRSLSFPKFQPDGKYLPQFLSGTLSFTEVMSEMEKKEENLMAQKISGNHHEKNKCYHHKLLS